MNELRDYLSPVARLMLSLVFIFSGIRKIQLYSGTALYMERYGVPELFLPLVIVTEIGGGLLLTIGYKARIAALLLAGFSLLSGIIFHLAYSWELEGSAAAIEMGQFWKNVAIAGGCLLVVSNGAGHLSIDRMKRGQEEEAIENGELV
ncbi:MAG: DoxX family protein [Sphingomonadaceae bacterium]|nr:MAG: DoxX family protein [Sphingomonadaceae bacterium]